jgi:hypothetical protein
VRGATVAPISRYRPAHPELTMKSRLRLPFQAAVFTLAACASAAGVRAASPQPMTPSTPAAGTVVERAGAKGAAQGCWAQLFLHENFAGTALTLQGPAQVENVARDWGFPWDPLYESVRVGPAATLTVYEETMFRDRTAVFGAGRAIADLDDVMGIFRSIRSVKLRCL